MKNLSRIYYSTGGYWKGLEAIQKLAEAAEVEEEVARLWLEKQVLWQIYLSPPKQIPVKRLPGLIKTMNNSVTRLIGSAPIDAIKMGEIKPINSNYKRVVGLDEKRLPGFVKVRYLLAPDENDGGGNRRATDPFWSLKMFNLKRRVVSSDQPVLYYLENGPKHGFVREELQVIPDDSELPPARVLK